MNIGDKLPEILGVNTKGETVRSSDFAGRPLIVYFYPKDATGISNLPIWVIQ